MPALSAMSSIVTSAYSPAENICFAASRISARRRTIRLERRRSFCASGSGLLSDSKVGTPQSIVLQKGGAETLHGAPSAFQHIGVIGRFQRVHNLLLDQQDRYTLVANRLHQLEYFLDQHRRQPERRLVQHQKARTRHQPAPDGAHL